MAIDSGSDKKILITGANGGMGRLCAQLAIEEGYQLVLADLASASFDDFSRTLSDQGVVTGRHELDVTDPDAIADIAGALEQCGGVNAIIHTVGVSPTMADWQRIINIDLVCTAQFLESVRPGLKQGGAAVCISSSSGYMCPPNAEIEQVLSNPMRADFFEQIAALTDKSLESPGLAYAYSKKALQRYVANRAGPWGREGKRIVSISPGLINTEMGQAEYEATEHFAAMKSRIALSRLGEPEEIANTALFLVSDKASYISGCDILVDGGLIASFS